MKVVKLGEAGYEWAAFGFSLSYNSEIDRTKMILPQYAFGIPGENKFLESIILWIDITAPRFFWSEGDTYRISTKQSESTMHTLCKKKLTQFNFEYPIYHSTLENLNKDIDRYKVSSGKKKIFYLHKIKNNLPDGFLQRREWCFSYKELQNIYNQRHKHKLRQWHIFLDGLISQLEHPEFIIGENMT